LPPRTADPPLGELSPGKKHHAQFPPSFPPYPPSSRRWRDHQHPVLLGDIGYSFGDCRPVRPKNCIHLVLCDQLLVVAASRLIVGAIVVDHQLNLASEHSTLGVHVLLAQQVSLTAVTPLRGVLFSRDRQ